MTPTIYDFKVWLQEQDLSSFTINKYLRDVSDLLAFAGNKAIDRSVAVEYKKKIISKHANTNTVNSKISSVNSYLKLCGMDRLDTLRVQYDPYVPESRVLTKDEYIRLVEAAESDTRLCCIIQTLGSTGIRISELKYIKAEDLKNGQTTVYCKKKKRRVFFTKRLIELLTAYAEAAGIRSGPVFVTGSGKEMSRNNIWRQLKRLAAKAGIQKSKVFPHNLRKVFASAYYNRYKDINRLSIFLGHSNINTTRIYLKSTDEADRCQLETLDMVILGLPNMVHNENYVAFLGSENILKSR